MISMDRLARHYKVLCCPRNPVSIEHVLTVLLFTGVTPAYREAAFMGGQLSE